MRGEIVSIAPPEPEGYISWERLRVMVVIIILSILVTVGVTIYISITMFQRTAEGCGCAFPECGNGTALGNPCVAMIEEVNSINPYCWVLDSNATLCEREPLTMGKSFRVTYWVNGTKVTLWCDWSKITESYWWWGYVNDTLVASCRYGEDGCCYIYNQSLYMTFNRTINVGTGS